MFNKNTLFFSIIICLLVALPVFAQSESGDKFIEFLNWLFSALLSIAAILAFVMIVLAGFRWVMAAGNPSTIEDAKDMITKAILGLVLAFLGWLILTTINPALVGGGGGGLPGGGGDGDEQQTPADPEDNPSMPSADMAAEEAARQFLADACQSGEGCVNINNTEACFDRETGASISFQEFRENYGSGCTSIGGLPMSTLQELVDIQNGCDCAVMITGGSEKGHQTHGPGRPIVDLRISTPLENYLNSNNYNYVNEGDHYHVVL